MALLIGVDRCQHRLRISLDQADLYGLEVPV